MEFKGGLRIFSMVAKEHDPLYLCIMSNIYACPLGQFLFEFRLGHLPWHPSMNCSRRGYPVISGNRSSNPINHLWGLFSKSRHGPPVWEAMCEHVQASRRRNDNKKGTTHNSPIYRLPDKCHRFQRSDLPLQLIEDCQLLSSCCSIGRWRHFFSDAFQTRTPSVGRFSKAGRALTNLGSISRDVARLQGALVS